MKQLKEYLHFLQTAVKRSSDIFISVDNNKFIAFSCNKNKDEFFTLTSKSSGIEDGLYRLSVMTNNLKLDLPLVKIDQLPLNEFTFFNIKKYGTKVKNKVLPTLKNNNPNSTFMTTHNKFIILIYENYLEVRKAFGSSSVKINDTNIQKKTTDILYFPEELMKKIGSLYFSSNHILIEINSEKIKLDYVTILKDKSVHEIPWNIKKKSNKIVLDKKAINLVKKGKFTKSSILYLNNNKLSVTKNKKTISKFYAYSFKFMTSFLDKGFSVYKVKFFIPSSKTQKESTSYHLMAVKDKISVIIPSLKN